MPVMKLSTGAHIFFDLTGPPDAPVVAFSNSLGTSLEMWDGETALLAARYRVLRYDTRGHGRSETIDRETSVEDLADDLAALLDGLHIPAAHIVGLSLGGMTAQAMGFRHPTKVLSLACVATAPAMNYPDLWNSRIKVAREEGMGALVDLTMTRWFTPAMLARDPAAVAKVRAQFLGTPGIGYAVCSQAIRDMDLRERLGAITAPTLVLSGSDDPATPPRDGQEIAARVPGAEYVQIPRAGHLINIEQPAVFGSHLAAWLDRQAGAPAARTGGSSFEAGLANRKAVLGVDYVQASLAKAGPYGAPFQDFITRAAWGDIWGDPRLPRKTRSMLVLATCIATNREEEFKIHLRPALKNGVTLDELSALMMQSAIYAGVPAANGAFRWTREVLGAEWTGQPAE